MRLFAARGFVATILFALVALAAPCALHAETILYNLFDQYDPSPHTTTAGSSLDFINVYNAEVAGTISGDGNVQVTLGAFGSGILTFSGENTYTGKTIVTSYSFLNLAGAGSISATSSVHLSLGADLWFSRSDTYVLSADIFGSGESLLQQRGSGTTILTGEVDVAGIYILAGALQIGNGGVTGSLAGNVLNNASLVFNRSDAITFTGAISGSGSLTKTGTGTLTLSGANTSTGSTTVTGGLISFAAPGNLGSGSITLDGGGLQWAAGNTADISSRLITLGSAGGIIDTNGNNLTFASALAGSGSLTKTGTGTLTLAGAGSYTGATTVTGGVITFNASSLGSGAITLDGGGLRWAAGNTADVSSQLITLGVAGGTVDTGSNSITFDSSLSGTGSLTKTGAGKLTLTAANTYSGDTMIDAGTLVADHHGQIGTFAPGSTVIVNAGGTLVAAGADSLGWGSGNAHLVINGGTVTTDNSADTHTTLQQVAMTGGHLTSPGENGRFLLNGPLVTHAAATTAVIDVPVLTLLSGWTSGVTTSFTVAQGFTASGIDLAISSTIAGTGPLIKYGAGTLLLTGVNTYSGGTTLSAGTLQLGDGGTTGSITGNVTNDATLAFNRSNDFTFSGVISGSGPVVKRGNGTLTLTGANTYAGTTTVFGGLIAFGSTGLGSGSITLDGGGLRWASGNTADVSSRLTALGTGGGTFDTNGNNVVFASAVSGAGALTKTGTGTLTLLGTNTYSGGTTLYAGTLALGSDDAIGAGTLTLHGGNLRAHASARTLTNNVVLAGDFTLGRLTNLAGTISLTKNLTLTSANPDTAAAATSTLSGVISGNYGITFVDGTNPTGAIVLAGANTYTGATTLQSGTLTLAHSFALQNSTFNYSGGSLGFGSLTNATFGSLAGTQNLALSNTSAASVALIVGGNNASSTYSGVLSGGGSLTKAGTGTLTLSGTNTFSGGTTINAGQIAFASADNFGSGSITLNGGGLRWASGNTSDISSRLAAFGSGGAVFDTNGNNITFESALSGTGSFTKAGSGTLTLAAASAYTGNTTISGGTLALATAGDPLTTTGTLHLTGGATLDLGGNTGTFSALGSASNRLVGNITAGTTITTGDTYLQSGTYANTFTGTSATGRLWIGGNTVGTVTLNGTNDAIYTADHNQVIIDYSLFGTVKLGSANALAAATENVQVFRGVLDLNGQTDVRANSITLQDSSSQLVNNDSAHAASYAGAVALSGYAAQLGGAGDLTLSGTLSGTGLYKIGAGMLALTNDSFFANPDLYRSLWLSDGTLALANATSFIFSNVSAGVLTEFNFEIGTLKFSGPGDTTVSGGYYTDGGYADADWGGLRFATDGQNVTLSNAFLYGTALVKTGAGTLTLTDTGSGYYGYTETYINEGTLALTQSGQLGGSGLDLGHENNATQGTLDLGGTTQTLSPGAEINVHAGTIANGTLATDGPVFVSGNATLDATFTGSGSSARLWINASSGSTVYLGGSNDRVYTPDHNQVIIGYSGDPTVKLLSSTALAAATENVEIRTGTLDLNGQTAVRAHSLVLKSGASSALVNSSAAAASYAGGVTLATGSAQLGGSGHLTLSGILSGTGGFTKIGTGTLTLSGANTYTGDTLVDAGALRVNGSLAGTVLTIASGATLAGNGTIGGATILLGGAHLAPGNSPGTITFSDGLTFAAGSIVDFELGAFSDLIRLTGGTLTGPSGTGGVTLNMFDSGGFAAGTYTLFDFATGGVVLADFDLTDFVFGTTIAGFDYSLGFAENTLLLTATASAIPEPSTYAALFGLFAFVCSAWQKRRCG